MTANALKAWIPGWLRPAPDSMSMRACRNGYHPALQAFNLLWSLWVFVTPVFVPIDAAYVWSLVISYPLFVLLFALVHVRPYRETWFYVMALALLAVACMPFNSAAWSYGVFACVYVPYSRKNTLLRAALGLAFVESILVLATVWLDWPWMMVATLVGVCTSAGCGAMVGRLNTIKNAAERASMAEVRRLAASAERERIGRDLHDLLGHTLSLITLKLELSRKLFDRDPDTARRELAEAEEVARHALAEVRAAVTGIRATGLVGEVASARLMLRASGVEFTSGEMLLLPDAIDDALAMVLREAVTNIHRHADAGHASVEVRLVGDHVVMCVRDDGRGGATVSGNGLHGMRERISVLDGAFTVTSRPGQGTEVSVDVPLPEPESPSTAISKPATQIDAPAMGNHLGSHA